MSLYGNRIQTVTESYDDIMDRESSITLEEFAQMQQNVIETIFESQEVLERAQMIYEGANIEYTKAFRAGKKKFVAAQKQCKKAIRAKDYKEAKRQAKIMKASCDEIQKAIESTKGTVESAVFGFFATGLLDMYENLIPCAFSLGGLAITSATAKNILASGTKLGAGAMIGVSAYWIGIIAMYINGIIVTVKDIINVIDRADSGDSAEDQVNLYRNRLLVYIKDMRKRVDRLESMIERKEKNPNV